MSMTLSLLIPLITFSLFTADSNEIAYVTALVVVLLMAVAEGGYILYLVRSNLRRALLDRCLHRAGTDAPD